MRSSVVQGFGVGIIGLYVTLIASGTRPTQQCVGDCDGDHIVTINELLTGVSVGLGTESVDACGAINCNALSLPPIICIIQAVNKRAERLSSADGDPRPATPRAEPANQRSTGSAPNRHHCHS